MTDLTPEQSELVYYGGRSDSPDKIICQYCGQNARLSFGCSIVKKMQAEQACFHCLYWLERIPRVKLRSQIVINGHMYQDKGDKPNAREGRTVAYLGFGGRRFTWRMLDTGEVVTSNDLWSNGKIPDRFREHFPDNAEWYKPGGE